MFVLHGCYLEDRFYLWAETSEGSEAPKRAGRRKKQGEPLPFGADLDSLREILEECSLEVSEDILEGRTMAAWLPTAGTQAIPSSPMIGESPQSRAKVTLKPWIVQALALDSIHALEFLSECVDKTILAPGQLLGHDLLFWVQLLRFTGALTVRQEFLPTMKLVDEQTLSARWEPVIEGRHFDRLNSMVGAMPHACRALSEISQDCPPLAALSTAQSFIQWLLQSLLCYSLHVENLKVSPASKTEASAGAIHEQWFAALSSPDNDFTHSKTNVGTFLEAFEQWRQPIEITQSAPCHLCLRLEEPVENGSDSAEEETWQLRYLLQSKADPSLLVEAEKLWNSEEEPIFPGATSQVQQYLLVALAQASKICPGIAESLERAAPFAYELDNKGAHHFLVEEAKALEQGGFSVLLPEWWAKGKSRRLSLKAVIETPKWQGAGRLTLDKIIRFHWEIALGEERLDWEEFQRLSELKLPLVRVRGQWLELSPEQIDEAIQFWKKKKTSSMTLQELVMLKLGASQPQTKLDFGGIEATGWVRDFLGQITGEQDYEEVEVPKGFQGQLRPYQKRGFSWLAFLRRWRLGSCLADDMGLGKTVQSLALIQRDWEQSKRGRRPVLLICPMSVMTNWSKEAERFTPDLPVMIHHGSKRLKGQAFVKKAKKQALVLSSYGLLHRDFDLFGKLAWGGLVLDEAQNIKNHQTKQAKAARAIAANYRVALTGTPVENNVGDLWSLMEFLNPGFLGTLTSFKKDFYVPIQVQRDSEAMGRLKNLTGPFVLRRLKSDKSIIQDLPEKVETKVYCHLSKEQTTLYQAVVKESLRQMSEAKGIKRKGVILATMTKLKQLCNHPAQFLGDNSRIAGRSGKLARFTEMVEEIAAVRDRALIFTQFTTMGDLLKRHLQESFGAEVFFLHGGTPRKQRQRMIDDFQSEKGGAKFFILSVKAGGTGLNLTRANHVFHFDRWWNPAVEDQATDRAFRIGQKRKVQVHKFVCLGTLEERIDEMIEAKKETASQVVGHGESWLTELSTTDLKKIFTLRKTAIAEDE